MIRLSKNEFELYGRATRVFVDYENYSQEECVFYYRILEHLCEGQEIYSSNYLISGLESIINQKDFSYKEIFVLRFMPSYNMSVCAVAEQIGISKQGLLQRYAMSYKYIRNQSDKYDISKRLAMLKGASEYLQAIRDNHNSQRLTRTVGIETLGLRTRAYNCLKAAGIDTVAQFASLSVEEIEKLPGVGEKTFEVILKSQRGLASDQNSLKHTELVLLLEYLEFGMRDKRCLNCLGVKTIEDFMKLTKQDVLGVWQTGEKTWERIYKKQQLLKFGKV